MGSTTWAAAGRLQLKHEWFTDAPAGALPYLRAVSLVID
jgi:hypothetical protein